MPSIGVYPLDGYLHEALIESDLYSITDIEVLRYRTIQPFFQIMEDLANGQSEHVARARYREWYDTVTEYLHPFIDLPEWENVSSKEKWEQYDDESWYSGGEPEWELLSEDPWWAMEIAEDLNVHEDGAQVLAEKLALHQNQQTVVLISYSLNCMYVVKSPYVAPCARTKWGGSGNYHAFADLGDPTERGDLLTYVIDPKVVDAAIKYEQEEQARWKKQQESDALSTQ